MKLLDVLESTECTDNCPEPSGVIFSYIALMIYMITANILLVNLLIAMFSSTFQDVQDNTDEIWRFQRYRLVFEYYDSSILPPPINFIAYLMSIVAYLRNMRKEKIEYDDSSYDLSLERKFAEEYLRIKKNQKAKTHDSKLKYTTER